MGSLKDMINFLEGTEGFIRSITEKLEKLQEQFNRNYNNVIEVRNSEIEFLQGEFFKDPGSFPGEVRELFNKGLANQEKSFAGNLSSLKKKREELKLELDVINEDRLAHSTRLKKTNTNLDKKEEALKAKVEELEAETEKYNRTIDELNTGFGFITNIFRMKKIEKEKNEILAKRDEIADQIEIIRNKWLEEEKNIGQQDSAIQEKWNYLQTEYSIICEKIETLETNRELLIKKGAFSEALAAIHGDEKFLTARSGVTPPASCRKCKSENSGNLFYCGFCGEPFSENRSDIAGSLVETGELNRIYISLTEGVRETVSIIALMRGVGKGIGTFISSIKKVKKTEDTYSQLPKLRIDVPSFSEEFSGKIAAIEQWIDFKHYNLHPLDFAKKIKSETEITLTAGNIEKFFTLMGDELNKTTKAQWR